MPTLAVLLVRPPSAYKGHDPARGQVRKDVTVIARHRHGGAARGAVIYSAGRSVSDVRGARVAAGPQPC